MTIKSTIQQKISSQIMMHRNVVGQQCKMIGNIIALFFLTKELCQFVLHGAKKVKELLCWIIVTTQMHQAFDGTYKH